MHTRTGLVLDLQAYKTMALHCVAAPWNSSALLCMSFLVLLLLLLHGSGPSLITPSYTCTPPCFPAETLIVLDLSNNALNDDMARMLASGLADNISVMQLNLSHNSISDRGVRALAKLLDANSIICSLDLSGNQLQADSGRALARAVCHSRALLSLNLRLNRLGDDGCRAICEALAHAGAAAAAGGGPAAGGGGGAASISSSSSSRSKGACLLQRLNLSSNGAGVGVVPAVCSMLRSCGSLQEFDLSCNQLGDKLSTDLVSAAGSNTGLFAFDVRGCDVGDEAEQALQQLMLDRVAEKEAGKLFGWAGGSSGAAGH